MYKNVNTGEVWKLDHVEVVNRKKVYVFENGDRWARDLFFKYWREVENWVWKCRDCPKEYPEHYKFTTVPHKCDCGGMVDLCVMENDVL